MPGPLVSPIKPNVMAGGVDQWQSPRHAQGAGFHLQRYKAPPQSHGLAHSMVQALGETWLQQDEQEEMPNL